MMVSRRHDLDILLTLLTTPTFAAFPSIVETEPVMARAVACRIGHHHRFENRGRRHQRDVRP